MENIKQLFNKLNLPTDFLNEFLQHAEIINLKRKGFFVKEGEVCQYIGIVEDGNLIAYLETENADVLVNELYSTQSLVSSYRSFLTQTPSIGSIQAIKDVKIYAISYCKYTSLQTSLSWSQFFRSISETLFLRKCTKETSLIKYSANERYQQLIDNNPNIEQQFPQYIIASYLKIRPETLSRMKSLDLHQHKR
ncbi:Crp/Fnr family transcriptional regulator [Solitalea lacus]|uniref:Crp/Fnr family transcriptional regulator n=1 Tax=Solitalea lacus TaxID=2911172 RepID=UPI001EDA9D7F|nr:hypothetical protein [Solitalea lacus]UKJ08765.1 hypothetical protein L2B55_06265 [Solitalea lacus]